jgi:hypothetical protein
VSFAVVVPAVITPGQYGNSLLGSDCLGLVVFRATHLALRTGTLLLLVGSVLWVGVKTGV